MNRFVYILVLTLVAVNSCHGSISCEKGIHESCPETNFISDFTDDERGYHRFPSDDAVTEKCSYALELINCTYTYMETCGNNSEQLHFKFLTSSFRDFAYELCDQTSQLRKEYKQHVPCLKEANDVENCLSSAMTQSQSFETVEDTASTESAISAAAKNLCRFYYYFKSCMVSATMTRCGESAATFMNIFLTKPVETLTRAHC